MHEIVKDGAKLFRAQLLIHDQAQAIFSRSLKFTRQTGYLKGHNAQVAVDVDSQLITDVEVVAGNQPGGHRPDGQGTPQGQYHQG